MTETDRDERDALAAEYVLGSLPADERRAAEARYAADPEFRRAVSRWEANLQPLADTAGESAPPAHVYDRIAAAIAAPAVDTGASNVVALHRQVRRWRLTSALVGAAAAALAGIVIFDRMVPPQAQSEFVAVLTSDGAAPAFVATVDVAKGTLSIRRVVDAPPPDKSFELWAVEPNATPVSLGVVDANLSRKLEQVPAGLTLAISLEPKGGSPTGVATGPIVFTGSLVPTE